MSVLKSRFVRNSKDAVTGLSRKYSTLKCLSALQSARVGGVKENRDMFHYKRQSS